MELIKVGEKTYYISNNTNIGVYKINDSEVYLIDTGNDSDAGKKILKILQENNLMVKGIINTHYHADHIGGNKIIQNRTNCDICSLAIEDLFITNPKLEAEMLYSSSCFSELYNKFLCAKESVITTNDLPLGLESISLKGHSINMRGIKTSDDIYFLADSIFSEETITKYHLFYIYNVAEYLESLDYLNTLEAKLFIPAHGKPLASIKSLIDLNKKKIMEICSIILQFCQEPQSWENLLQQIFDYYQLSMNLNQYFLIGSTLKAYLTYLKENNKIEYIFENNQMLWQKVYE